MKKTLKIFLTLLFSVAVIFSAPVDTAAADKDDFCGFGVSFSVDGFDYTINCKKQKKIGGAEWYLQRPDYLTPANEDDIWHLILPHHLSSAQLYAVLTEDGEYILDGIPVYNGTEISFADGTTHTLSAAGRNYRIVVSYGSDIPAVYIDTETGSLDNIYADKNNREAADMAVVEDGKVVYSKELDFIKGRGNFTWAELPKRSFSVRLIEEADLFGMGMSKNYAIMTNHTDMAAVRNKLICDFAADMGLPFSPQAEFVDLYVNNEYMGLYAFTEKIEVGEGRVDINNLEQQTMDLNLYDRVQDARQMGQYTAQAVFSPGSRKWVDVKNNPSDISGGYVLELELHERYWEEPGGFVSDYGQPVVLSSPKYVSEAQIEYISDYYQQFEDALISPDGYNSLGRHYSEYADMDSLVKMHIIQEYAKNLDAAVTSFYFYKDIGGKLVAAPIWDMDSGFGRVYERDGVDFNSPEQLWASGGRMVGQDVGNKHTILALLWQHEDYRNAVFEQWHTNFAPKTEQLVQKFEDMSAEIEKSKLNDRQMWLGGKLTEQSIERWCSEAKNFVADFIRIRSEYLSGIYSADCMRVTYDANGGRYVTLDGNLYREGDNAVVADNRFRYDGADFTGWNTAADGSGTAYQPGETFAVAEDITLYAQWSMHPAAEQTAEEGGIVALIKKIIRKILG